MARLVSDFVRSRRAEPVFDLVGREAVAALESRCNMSPVERYATSPKALPLAADPSGAVGRPVPLTSKGRLYCCRAGLVHAAICDQQRREDDVPPVMLSTWQILSA